MLLRFFKKILSYFYTHLAKLTINSPSSFKANGYTKFNKNTTLGVNCHFNGLVINGSGKVDIGDNFHSGANCRVITDYHNYNGESIPYDKTWISKSVIIKDNVWIGRDVTILGGVTIGEGAIIQVGSVVVSDIPDCSIAGGHPARVYSKRDVDKYIRLKQEGKFH